MRVLVVGPYPPHPGHAAAVTRQEVEHLLSDDHVVEVLSPTPSAAHSHAKLLGLRGAWALARRARHFDKVVVRLGPGLFLRHNPNRVQRLLDIGLLSSALRLWEHGELQIDDLAAIPGDVGGRSGLLLWSAVDGIVVADEAARLAVHAGTGLAQERIRVRPLDRTGSRDDPLDGLPEVAPGSPLPPWRVDGGTAWLELVAQVRQRAAVERATARAQPMDRASEPGFDEPKLLPRPLWRRAVAKAMREMSRLARRERS
ncbi:MAG TPA: hypothetical protein VMY34_10310 [Acidimicrobiales bacterium]|nr:hypothetical protein [Acidimicrobiales bacterium]